MTYAIGTVVFGLNFKELDNKPDWFHATPADLEILGETNYLKTEYSGNGDEPRYLGVVLDSIDEANDVSFVELLEMANKANEPSVLAEFSQMKADLLAEEDLSDQFKDHIKSLKPNVFVTWGTS